MRRQLAICFLAAVAVSSGCRTSDPNALDSEFESTPDNRTWYGADGYSGQCQAPAAACTSFSDDHDFVDLCVAKGFQAKTCGCAVLCSGKVDYQAPVAASAPTQPGASGKASTCAKANLDLIARATKVRPAGEHLDRCITSYVCNGVRGSCDGADLALANKLRVAGRSGCEEELVNGHCRSGFVDSLQCGENDVALLSATWTDFKSKTREFRRCVRKAVCGGEQQACSGKLGQEVERLKAAINRDGCQYWLQTFCSLGASSL